MGVPGLLGRLPESRTYFRKAETLQALLTPAVQPAIHQGSSLDFYPSYLIDPLMPDTSPPLHRQIHTVVDMSVIWFIISSIHPNFPAYRFFADDFRDADKKNEFYDSLAAMTIQYLQFLFIPGNNVYLMLERQTGTKVTATTRNANKAKRINSGLDLLFCSTLHGHESQGKELINRSISFTWYDQAEIAKRILDQMPGISSSLSHHHPGTGFIAYVCIGEADSGILDVIEDIKSRDSTAMTLVCSSDSDYLFMPEAGRGEALSDLVDFVIVPQFQ